MRPRALRSARVVRAKDDVCDGPARPFALDKQEDTLHFVPGALQEHRNKQASSALVRLPGK